jgi:recombination protein RecR
MNQKFKDIVKILQKLPGVGPRQATRFLLALLEKDDQELKEMGQAISNLKQEITFCYSCFNVSENGLCDICSNSQRENSKLLILEKVTDLESVEKAGIYKGLYHVLGGSINPLDGATPDKLRFRELENRVHNLIKEHHYIELIIATNPNASGETTSLYIRDLFKNKKGVAITRLGRGLASGSNLEYADEITLKHALEHRK